MPLIARILNKNKIKLKKNDVDRYVSAQGSNSVTASSINLIVMSSKDPYSNN